MELNNKQLAELVNPVCEISQQAGSKIMKIYQEGFDIEEKNDRSPLTSADLASHRLITKSLKELTPNIPVLSEESSEIPYSERSAWENYWLIDPLDGTREFIKRNGEFTVNIALITNQVAILGVVYIPVQDIYYFASKENGSFKKEQNQPASRISTRNSTPNDKPVICGSRSHAGKSLQALLDEIGDYELISMGSSIKTCLVAERAADIYPRFGPTSEWDTAAAHCIVDEAGGILVDTSLNPLRYNTKDSLLNPSFIVIGNLNDSWREFLIKFSN